MANFLSVSKIIGKQFRKLISSNKSNIRSSGKIFVSKPDVPVKNIVSPYAVKIKTQKDAIKKIADITKLDKKTAAKLYDFLPESARENFSTLLAAGEKLGYITKTSNGSVTGKSLERFLTVLDKNTYDKIITLEQNYKNLSRADFNKVLNLYKSSDEIIQNRTNIEKWLSVKEDLYKYAKQLEIEGEKAAGLIKDETGKVIGFENGSAAEQIYEIFGVVPQARGKGVESIYDKLSKKVLKKGADIRSLEDARSQIGDLVGTRLVLDDISPDGIQKVVDNLCKAIENGKIDVTEINNYAKSSSRYFSQAHFKQIDKSAARVHMKVKNLDTDKQLSESGYVTTQMNIVHSNGAQGELQIRGKLMMKYAEIEHIPYDIRMGKNIGKNIPELESFYRPVQDAVTKLKRNGLDKEYDNYILKCYQYIRKYELGEIQGEFKLPKLPSKLKDYSILSFENLEIIHCNAKAIKDAAEHVVKN